LASLEPIRTFPTREQQIHNKNEHATAVLPFPRRACAQQLAQNQAQIERAHMDQLPLENVFVSAQMAASHSTRLVAVREAADQKPFFFRNPDLQRLAKCEDYLPTV
jgi:hypothetical protein